MSRTVAYNVPSNLIADQGIKISELYKADNAENHAKLASIGLKAASFDKIGVLGHKLADLEQDQEEHKAEAKVEQAQATQAATEALEWRNEEVIPRAKLVFHDDPRLSYFRPGALRSRRAASIDREVRILIDTIRDFAHLPETQEVGLDTALADKGQTLLDALRTQDMEYVKADAERSAATATLRELEAELSSLLASVEQRAAIVLKRGSADLRRYRMNEIRNYVAMQHKAGTEATDPTVSISVEDPDPGSADDE